MVYVSLEFRNWLVIQKLRQQVERYGSQKALAAALGVSTSYLNDVLMGRREPGESILKAMGYERVVMYKDIGAGEYPARFY